MCIRDRDQVGDVFSVPIMGAVNIYGTSLSGAMDLTYSYSEDSWVIDFDDLTLVVAAAGVAVSLSQGTGQLRIDSNRRVSGTVSGSLSITGVDGLTLAAKGSVKFPTDTSDLAISANGVFIIDGFATLTANFSVEKQETDQGERFVVGANDAAVSVGDAGNGLSVSNVDLAMVLQRGALGGMGLAMVAEGAVALDGLELCL